MTNDSKKQSVYLFTCFSMNTEQNDKLLNYFVYKINCVEFVMYILNYF